MTVKQLKQKLNEMPDNCLVVIYNEEDNSDSFCTDVRLMAGFNDNKFSMAKQRRDNSKYCVLYG